MEPLLVRVIKNVVSRVGRVRCGSGLLLDEELKFLFQPPVPNHVCMRSFTFAAKPVENGFWIRLSNFRVQSSGCVPNGKYGPAFTRGVVLDAAIAACGLAGMPVGTAVVNAGLRREDSDLAVEACGFFFPLQFPPEVLGLCAYAGKKHQQGNQPAKPPPISRC